MKVVLKLVLVILVLVDVYSSTAANCKTKIKVKCKRKRDVDALKGDIHDSVVESLSDENRLKYVREVEERLNKANTVEDINHLFFDEF